jgi:phosphoglycolate phosphatase-like HAD superfamily hydrolase
MIERALVFNFDGTMADTFAPSAGGISTTGAYEYAIAKVFGKSELERYRRGGGLKNRPPAQVVHDLGVPGRELPDFTDRLVHEKLEYLVPEIGRRAVELGAWPQLLPGFNEFWAAAQGMVDRGELLIAGVGSGHREFISRTFEVHHLDLPVFITDEDVRAWADYSYTNHSPNTLKFELVAQQLGLQSIRELVYVADDPVIDAQMARRAGVPFIHFDRTLGAELRREAEPGLVIFHAGTKLHGGDLLTSGGRVFGVSATGENLRDAKAAAYAALGRVRFDGAHYRTDIGDKSLVD